MKLINNMRKQRTKEISINKKNENFKQKLKDSEKSETHLKDSKMENQTLDKIKSAFCGKWYEEFQFPEGGTLNEIPFERIQILRKEASSIYSEAVILNNSRPPKSLSHSDYAWIKTVLSKGTKTDKVAAYTLLIQDCPLYNLNLLKNMIEMVKVGKKKECFMAVDNLCELFLNELLPPTRKLLQFSSQPLSKLDEITSGNVVKKKKVLFLWYFEDQLKSCYSDFIEHLNKIGHDSVDANKQKIISAMCKLLEGNPEKENLLLNQIVNKLGDPSHKVGSKVIYSLTKVLQTHPNMKEVVIDAVEKVIFRSNISKRAQYYSICFLIQFCLFEGDGKIAKKLITIYLSLFKACIKTGDVDSRMMSALLTGVKRAYPYGKDELEMLKDHINTIFKVIHLSHANISIQALSLIYLISDYSNAFLNRFYSALYKKIGEVEMFKSTHHAMLISLIFRALKKDNDINRIIAIVKRLFQVCTYIPIPTACGLLIMISQLIKGKKNVLLKELSYTNNKIFKIEEDENDDGIEHYVDVEEIDSIKIEKEEISEKNTNLPKNVIKTNPIENIKVWSNPDKSVEKLEDAIIGDYNPFARNPLYAGAHNTLYYELFKLNKHFHPTVSLFADKIINGEVIAYSGDPLLDFTLIRFLDKFSFKNPKIIKPEMEQNLTFSKFSRKKYYTSTTVRRLRANTTDYLKHSEKNIPVDEMFLYRYMKEKSLKQPVPKKDDLSDVESVRSDEFDDFLSDWGEGKKSDVDFMSEIGSLPKKEKKLKKDSRMEESDDEIDKKNDTEDIDDSDELDEDLFAEDFEGNEIDEFEDGEEMEGSEVDEAELEASGFKLPDLSNLKDFKHKKNKKKSFKNSLFASAEEFAELLEETDRDAGGSEAFSNKDKAGVKQLRWESDRDKWIHNNNFKGKGVKRPYPGKKFQQFLKKGKKKRF